MDIDDKHSMNIQKYDNTDFFYQRALIHSINLSVGILITTIMIFRIKK